MIPATEFVRFIEFKKARVGLRKDSIVQTDIFPEQELSVDDVKEVIEGIAIVGRQTMYPQLIVAGQLSGPDLQAMKHIASDGSSPYAIAEAYVIKSLSQKIIARFYLNFNKPARPTKMFSEVPEAIAWLNEQARLYEKRKNK